MTGNGLPTFTEPLEPIPPPAGPWTAATAHSKSLDPTGLTLGLLGAFLFSWKPIFVKLLYAEGVDAESQLLLRFGIALPLYVVIGAYAYLDRRRRRLTTDLSLPLILRTVAIGIVGYYLAAYFDMLALARITAQFERLVLFTYPAFVAILGYWFFRERLSPALLGALAITYGGLSLVFIKDLESFGPQVIAGTLFVLVSAIAYALYLLFSKGLIGRMGSALFTTISMVSGAGLIFLQFLFTHSFADIPMSWTVAWLSLGIAVISTVVPSFLISEAIARMGPASTSVIGGSGPIITTLLAVWLLGEPFTAWHLFGMMLVIGGILLLSRSRG